VTTVRVIKNWLWPDLLRQTPRGSGVWKTIRFTLDDCEQSDYVIVLNHVREDINVVCPKENVWILLQEPANEFYGWWHRANNVYRKVLTSDSSLKGSRYIHSHPATPWHVNRSYDFLLQCDIPVKPLKLSWVTSNLASFQGQRQRLDFLEKIRSKIPFDLFGRGFRPIEDKWDGLAPYRYSLAIENFRGLYYWTEKLADCFLCWTMPIYCGCENVDDYFPPESMIRIDINDPDIVKRLPDIIESDLWLKRRDAIAEARDLCLNRYQFFPHIADLIDRDIAQVNDRALAKRKVIIPGENKTTVPLLQRIKNKLNSFSLFSAHR
jgi:hypothetical protein